MPDLTHRHRQPEVMDQPGLDDGSHRLALSALARINWLSGSARILWRPLRALAKRYPHKRLRVLDVATGGGDVPITLARWARRAGLSLEWAGCDVSECALHCAYELARRRWARVRFFPLDVFKDPLPTEYDVLTCSLFLHHLDEGPAIDLLRRMGAAAREAILVNDLERTAIGYRLAYYGSRILSRSPVVHVDGPRSVEGAFTTDEALRLAEQAGLKGASVARRFPSRYLLTWERH